MFSWANRTVLYGLLFLPNKIVRFVAATRTGSAASVTAQDTYTVDRSPLMDGQALTTMLQTLN